MLCPFRCTTPSMAWNLFNKSKNRFYHRKTGFTNVKPVKVEENSLAHICDTYDLHNLPRALKVSKVPSLTYVLYQSPYALNLP